MTFNPLDPLGIFRPRRGPSLKDIDAEVVAQGEMFYILAYEGDQLIDWDAHHKLDAIRSLTDRMRRKYPTAVFRAIHVERYIVPL